MTMNSSGPIDLAGSTPGQSIAYELGRVGTPISLNDADVRALAGIPSGPISFTDFYGKSAGGGGGGGSGPQPQPGALWDWAGYNVGTVSVPATIARINMEFAANGQVNAYYDSGVVTGAPLALNALKNWAPTQAGIGVNYWMRITIITAQVEYYEAPSFPPDGIIPISVTTASGSTNVGFPVSYAKNWGFTMAPLAWQNMASGIILSSSITVPASSSQLKSSTIYISGTVEFASSAGGSVIYQDNFAIRSSVDPL